MGHLLSCPVACSRVQSWSTEWGNDPVAERVTVREYFADELDARWQRHVVGSGSLEACASALRFVVTDATSQQYSNAQIDDYQGLPRHSFLWRPPLKLTVRARFSHPREQLQGTAGFGFWNDPFLMTGPRLPALPRAIWFFHASPPSDMKLDLQTPGHGWKAAAIDALNPTALLWAPLAPLAIPLMKLPAVYRALWPPIQRALRVREAAIIVDMTQWHTYVLEWNKVRSRFSLTSDANSPAVPILDAPSPGNPLGFVMWMDNQYLAATPWGRFRWGLLDVPGRQWMEVDRLVIQSFEDGKLP